MLLHSFLSLCVKRMIIVFILIFPAIFIKLVVPSLPAPAFLFLLPASGCANFFLRVKSVAGLHLINFSSCACVRARACVSACVRVRAHKNYSLKNNCAATLCRSSPARGEAERTEFVECSRVPSSAWAGNSLDYYLPTDTKRSEVYVLPYKDPHPYLRQIGVLLLGLLPPSKRFSDRCYRKGNNEDENSSLEC